MAGNNVKSEQDAVVVEIEIAASPSRVFQALTDQKQLFSWWSTEPSVELTRFEMSPNQGGSWRFTCKARAGRDHGEVGRQMETTGAAEFEAYGEVVESVPPRLLVWSWIANWHDRPQQTTFVHWELEPTETGTRVRVTHSGLAGLPVARQDYGKGWQGVVQLLRDFLEAVAQKSPGSAA